MNFQAYSVRRLAQLAWRECNYAKAMALCTESLKLNLGVGDRRGMIACLSGFANISVAQGALERAAKLMAVVETQLASLGVRLLQLDKMESERNLAFLRSKLDAKTLAKSWGKGRAMSLDDAIAFAFAE